MPSVKTDVPFDRAQRLISAGSVCLLTTSHKGRANIMTCGWISPVSYRPVLIAVSVFQGTMTHDIIKSSEEFTINVPSWDLLRQVRYCGANSGRDVDKFAATGLHEAETRYVRAPLIDECIGHIECAVVERLTPGDHTIFIGEVVAVQAESAAFDDVWLLKERDLRPLQHLGGEHYAVLEVAAERTAEEAD